MISNRIQHTFEQGTLLLGTSPNDGTGAILKPLRRTWKFSDYIDTDEGSGAWYLRGSRNQPARRAVLREAAAALRAAGREVTVEVDNTAPPVEDREAFVAERAQQRAEALQESAGRHQNAGEARYERGRQVLENIPMGQPYLPDHSGYAADRHRRERALRNEQQGTAQIQHGQHLAERATTAQQRMDFRESPITVANRIERMVAEQNKIHRQLDGTQHPELVTDEHDRVLTRDGKPLTRPRPATGEHRSDLEARAAQLDDDLRYWRQIRDQQIAEGRATNYGPDDIHRGDRVHYRGEWLDVVRVNKKSVTVARFVGTRTVPYPRIEDVITAQRWAELAQPAEDEDTDR